MKIEYLSILHSSVLVEDLARSLKFYVDLLGFEVDPLRPDLGYPGAWLKVGDQQIHLLQLPNPDPAERPQHGGHDRHIAIAVNSIDQIRELLESNNIDYTISKSRSHVVFIRDPDGNALELIGLIQVNR